MSSLLKIKFVGKDIPAPEFLTDGKIRIDLPKSQKRPFTHVHARRILNVASELYKKVIPKGKK